jgi:hypothetical protein
MQRTIKKTAYFLLLTLSASLLFGCGGGSSSSGVGSPAPTPYAGIYDGVLNLTAQGIGGSVSDSVPYRVVVGVDGQVTESLPGFSGTTTCDDDGKKYYMTNNILEYSETVNCYDPNLGSCSVEGSTRYVFNTIATSISGSAKFFCQSGNFTAQISAYLPKTSS